MKKNQVSVIIRNFNNQGTIKRSIDSALEQNSVGKIEIIVIDDRSQDESLKIIKTFGSKIIFLTNEQKGAINALNFALKASSGEYFFILDGDDYIPQNTIQKLLSLALKNPDKSAVYGNYYEVDSNKKDIVMRSTKKNIFHTVAGGILYKKSKVMAHGGYDNSLFFPEYDLIFKLGEANMLHIDKPVYYYCRHNNSLTSNKQKVASGVKQLEEIYGVRIPIRDY